jgi:hypothetical protein
LPPANSNVVYVPMVIYVPMVYSPGGNPPTPYGPLVYPPPGSMPQAFVPQAYTSPPVPPSGITPPMYAPPGYTPRPCPPSTNPPPTFAPPANTAPSYAPPPSNYTPAAPAAPSYNPPTPALYDRYGSPLPKCASLYWTPPAADVSPADPAGAASPKPQVKFLTAEPPQPPAAPPFPSHRPLTVEELMQWRQLADEHYELYGQFRELLDKYLKWQTGVQSILAYDSAAEADRPVASATSTPPAPSGFAQGDTMLLAFYSDSCRVCREMSPTVQTLISSGYPVRRVDVGQNAPLAAQYSVRSIPCFVMLVGGREVDRSIGKTSVSRLQQMCQAGAPAPTLTPATFTPAANAPTGSGPAPSPSGSAPPPPPGWDPYAIQSMPPCAPYPLPQTAAVAKLCTGSPVAIPPPTMAPCVPADGPQVASMPVPQMASPGGTSIFNPFSLLAAIVRPTPVVPVADEEASRKLAAASQVKTFTEKEGPCTIRKRENLNDAFTVEIGQNIHGTCKFYIDDFLGQTIINANMSVKNVSKERRNCRYYVAFFDKDGKLVGCANQGLCDEGLASGEDTNMCSCLVFVPPGTAETVTSYKVRFYETDKLPEKKHLKR